MNYYDNLNKAIKNSLDNPELQYQFRYFDEISKLSKIVIDSTDNLNFKKTFSYIPINDSIQNALSFFSSINPQYSYMFQNILQENVSGDYSVKFLKTLDSNQLEENMARESRVTKDGKVYIYYSNTLEDIFNITHEITHKFSQPKNQGSTIKQFLGETSSIAMEFLLQDYLFQKSDYDDNEILAHKNNRLLETYDDACSVLFENILLKLYKESNGCVTQELLFEYLNSIDKDSNLYNILSSRGEQYLNEIVNSGHLNFYIRQRYVIGTVLASYYHDKIKNNPENVSQLCYLIDILGHTDLLADVDLKALSNLEVPIFKNCEINIDETEVSKLSKIYKSEVLDVLRMHSKNLGI